VCSADTPDFQLLWDSGLRSSFNFVFHDCTTFAPFTAEMDVVDDVHELLGRKARRVGGKEGVTYVLRSLPENAKNLFKLLVGEVLMAIDDEGTTGGENPGVEYRMMYGKAVEEFICSSEMAFRTLLKEWVSPHVRLMLNDVLTVITTGFTIIKLSRVGRMSLARNCLVCRSARRSLKRFWRIWSHETCVDVESESLVMPTSPGTRNCYINVEIDTHAFELIPPHGVLMPC